MNVYIPAYVYTLKKIQKGKENFVFKSGIYICIIIRHCSVEGGFENRSCTMGTGTFVGVCCRGLTLITPPPISAEVK